MGKKKNRARVRRWFFPTRVSTCWQKKNFTKWRISVGILHLKSKTTSDLKGGLCSLNQSAKTSRSQPQKACGKQKKPTKHDPRKQRKRCWNVCLSRMDVWRGDVGTGCDISSQDSAVYFIATQQALVVSRWILQVQHRFSTYIWTAIPRQSSINEHGEEESQQNDFFPHPNPDAPCIEYLPSHLPQI